MGDANRRSQILDGAATTLATSGVRASMADIARACGVQPGTLYHYFDSKEALIVALLRRFHDELESVARNFDEQQIDSIGSRAALVELGVAIAAVARRHPAAMAFTYIEAPASAGEDLRMLARTAPLSVEQAMSSLLIGGQGRGTFRNELNVAVLGTQISRVMLQSALVSEQQSEVGPSIARLKCEIVLDGVLAPAQRDKSTEWGAAHAEADEVIASWGTADDDRADRAAHIRRVASEEFAKRGVELTRIRDVAAAAGIDQRAVYRVIPSKEALIESILSGYLHHLEEGWQRVVRSNGPPGERLDALLWLTINAQLRFGAEHRTLALSIQQGSQSSSARQVFQHQVRDLVGLLGDGEASGFRDVAPQQARLGAGAVFSMMFPAANLVQQVGPAECLDLARDLLMRGISTSPQE